MAVYATHAKRVTDDMFIEAAGAVADQVSRHPAQAGLLYPLQANILETEIQTAARVAKLVFDSAVSPALTAPPTWWRSSAATSTSPTTKSWAAEAGRKERDSARSTIRNTSNKPRVTHWLQGGSDDNN